MASWHEAEVKYGLTILNRGVGVTKVTAHMSTSMVADASATRVLQGDDRAIGVTLDEDWL